MATRQVSNVLLYHGKYLCNNQIASLAQFIDTCFYKEKMCPILLLKLVYCCITIYVEVLKKNWSISWKMLFTNGGTCLFDIFHSALWGSKYPVCMPDAQVLFLSGARMLHTQHSTVQALPSRV
jgi:hypothetical protein